MSGSESSRILKKEDRSQVLIDISFGTIGDCLHLTRLDSQPLYMPKFSQAGGIDFRVGH